MKRIAILIALAVSLLFPMTVFAEGNVTYIGGSEGFVFEPGSSNSPTDLFNNFKNIVPGDSITDTVVVKNDSQGRVNIYLKALGANGGEDFLAQFKLKVVKDGETLFDATANQTAGLTDFVLLGNFAKGETATLDISIEVPVTMSNSFQDAIGVIQWQFKVEELDTPKTGDEANLMLWVFLLGVSSLAVVLTLKHRSKHQ